MVKNGEGMIWKEVRHAVGACISEEGAETPPLSLLAGWASALRQDHETTTSQAEYLCKQSVPALLIKRSTSFCIKPRPLHQEFS